MDVPSSFENIQQCGLCQKDFFEPEDNPALVPYPQQVVMLQCGHRFHDEFFHYLHEGRKRPLEGRDVHYSGFMTGRLLSDTYYVLS